VNHLRPSLFVVRKSPHGTLGLVCLTGGDEGPLAAALERGGMDKGRELLRSLIGTFGPKNVYVELQRHRIREQEARNEAAAVLSREFHLPGRLRRYGRRRGASPNGPLPRSAPQHERLPCQRPSDASQRSDGAYPFPKTSSLGNTATP
jgi:hypothetical protein